MFSKLVDGFISTFNPHAALRRAQARRVLRAYSGAEPSRLNANRRPKNNAADAELAGPFGANQMRAWARMLVRDNAWAWGVVDTFVNSVVGKGIDIQSAYETDSGADVEVINERRDEVWRRWAEVCEINGQYTFSELQQMAMREIVEAGEVLIRMVPVDRRFRGIYRPVPLALELIEADRLAEEKDTYNLPLHDKHRINRGIELDELGRPVAYWIYPNHPNDPYTTRGEPRRIEAEEIIHLFNRQRIGQTRGISMFAPCVSWIRDLGTYVENELQASAVASCFTVAIKTEGGISGLNPPSSAIPNSSDADGNKYEYLQPGLVMHLAPNESIESANPGRPNSASEPWIKLMLRGIAVGTGLSYETVARDYSQTNYSSNRASQLEDRRRFRRWQQYLIEKLNQRVWDKFCMSAAMVDLNGFPQASELLDNPRKAAPCEHMPPSWEWVDPQSEQQSSEAGIKAFQTTYLDELGSRGKNWRHVFYQRAKEEQLLKQLGLASPTEIAGAAVKQAETPAAGTQPGMPENAASVAPSGSGEAGAAEVEQALSATGEMMGLSRLQWQRNRKAILDVVNDYTSNTISKAQAVVLLSGLGLRSETIQYLIEDVQPEEITLACDGTDLKKKDERAFCPTGEGGGVDNSCPPADGNPASKQVTKDKLKTGDKVTIQKKGSKTVHAGQITNIEELGGGKTAITYKDVNGQEKKVQIMNKATIHVQELSQAVANPKSAAEAVKAKTQAVVAEKQKQESKIENAGTHPEKNGISSGPVTSIPPGPKPFALDSKSIGKAEKYVDQFTNNLESSKSNQTSLEKPQGWSQKETYPSLSSGQNKIIYNNLQVRDSIEKYSGIYYEELNAGLREDGLSKMPAGMKKMAMSLDAVTRVPLGKEITVYRGTESKAVTYGITNTPVGGSFTDEGFGSTTTNLKTAKSFGEMNGSVLMKIKTKYGVPIRNFSEFSEENEVLLPRNMRYTVTKKEWQKIDGEWKMCVEVDASLGKE